MKMRLTSIPAIGAAMALSLAAATARAQVGRTEVGAEIARRQAEQARRWGRVGLANQLRPFYRYELMHARTACGLTKEELRRIRPEADAAYGEAIANLEAARLQKLRSEGEDIDYHDAIRDAVHAVVKRRVSRERWEKLQSDLPLRVAARKEAGVDLLVALIDREILLTGRQREQVAASLSAHWDDRWCDPIEAAFAQGSGSPDIPDGLILPHLSDAQRRAWNRTPKTRGRLWGVSIDHGGDPEMEQELGAAGPVEPRPGAPLRWTPIDPPRDPQKPVQERIAIIQPANRVVLQRVNQAVVVMPARVVAPVPAPVPEEGEDADDAADRVRRQQQEQQRRILEIYRQRFFEQPVFGRTGSEDQFRLEAEAALTARVDHLVRAGGLTEAQRRKLLAAGRGDIKRFLDHVDAERRGFPEDGDRRAMALRFQEAGEKLAGQRDPVLAVGGPIFAGVVARMLTDAHRAALERDAHDRLVFRHRADIRWTAVMLARSLGLVDDQRRRLESLLLERITLPRNFNSSDSVIVMFQAARVAGWEMRQIVDDLQWRTMRQEFAAAERWELFLIKNGVVENRNDATRDGPMPPIQLLAPPAIRRR